MVNGTHIFDIVSPTEKAYILGMLRAYWNGWIEQGLNELYNVAQGNKI